MIQLSPDQLLSKFFAEVANERRSMSRVLKIIVEIDRRRLYLERKCTSLTQFLIQEAGYSKQAAQRRKDAARMIQEMPELFSHFESGAINLSQVSQFARLMREKEKSGRVDTEFKRKVLAQIKHQSTDQTEKLLCQLLGIQPVKIELARLQADQSMRREATFTEEDENMFRRVREIMSHKNPNPTFSELVRFVTTEFLKAHCPLQMPEVDGQRLGGLSKNPFHISAATRTYLFQTQKCCQQKYDDGTVCGSRFLLEVDHIVRPADGGTNALENLQLLCDQHNRSKYRKGA